ncbi:hypothetical protein LOTGIDRAFT_162875 [Lottia gigantea]|uniref:Uncharacterized protein n=1 Tax=Lottia gigantea TaxID=225164 RepID=V4AFQ7_LOTGI|nr:hypothetical protein LOTGIDRAFT_162875 [Lottia gigantea]ESO92221.1 hypothetical protein LOTGIDRAFT_162875 [Lottia gigantea]
MSNKVDIVTASTRADIPNNIMALIAAKWIIIWIFFITLESISGLKCFSCDSYFISGCIEFDSSQSFLMSCDPSLKPVSCQKIERKLNGSKEYRVRRDCVYQEYEEQITPINMECQATGSTTGVHNMNKVYICIRAAKQYIVILEL